MFNSKQKQLFETGSKTTTSVFVTEAKKVTNVTLSENGAKKYTTTDDEFVNQFNNMSTYKAQRSFEDISKDMSTLWAIHSLLTIMFTLFLRTITRATILFTGEKLGVQRGAGLKHESIMRMMWIHVYHPNSFWKNIHLYISIASWKDIITMLSYDLQYNGWDGRKLNWNEFGKFLLAGLENPQHSNLIKKYLPQIKANSLCTTIESQADNIIAKWICSLLFGGKDGDYSKYKLYRKMKTSGNAHEWQKLISQRKFNLIDFNTIHGKALAQLVSSSFLEKSKLTDKYIAWLDTQDVVKYTGYPSDLFIKLPTSLAGINTLNKQFMQLVNVAKTNINTNTGMIVVRDTSGSMDNPPYTGFTQSCYSIAKAIALFFSYMLPDGKFSNSWIEFNNTALMHTWNGSTPYEKWSNDGSSYYGSTNFQSVIDLFCKLKKQGISESEFPTGIICISDFEFNPTELNKTNVEVAYEKLINFSFSKEYVSNFKIVLWNLRSSNKFETFGDVKNVFYFSGYDPSILAFLTGIEQPNKPNAKTPETAKELFLSAMDQEVLRKVLI